jgi:hypothetical protein
MPKSFAIWLLHFPSPFFDVLGDLAKWQPEPFLCIPSQGGYVGLRINRVNMALPAASPKDGGFLISSL